MPHAPFHIAMHALCTSARVCGVRACIFAQAAVAELQPGRAQRQVLELHVQVLARAGSDRRRHLAEVGRPAVHCAPGRSDKAVAAIDEHQVAG